MRVKLLLAFLILMSLSSHGLMQKTQTPRFEEAACPVLVANDVRCGYLVVPENRDEPESREIRLAVGIFPARSEMPKPDPVVYLAGGPGESAFANLQIWNRSSLRAERNLIVLEQRGTRYSEPSLFCYEIQVALRENLSVSDPLADEIARETAAAEHCRDRLTKDGVDLGAYHSRATALDLEDLRVVLGYPAWNLYGVSYGTRVALEAMRTTPQGIRSVILDSVYPPEYLSQVRRIPDAEAAFERIFDACAAQSACQSAYPSLKEDFYVLLRRLDETPIHLTMRLWGEVALDGGDFAALVFFMFYNNGSIPYIPYVIEEVKQGHYWVLLPLLDAFVPLAAEAFAEGVYYSVECHERVSFMTPEMLDEARAAVPDLANLFGFRSDISICGVWGAGQADASALEPVTSDIPTLILAGEYDPVTPAYLAEAVQKTLPNSQLFVLPNRGHVIGFAPCTTNLIPAFLNDPTASLDDSCHESVVPLRFATNKELWATPAFYRMVNEASPVSPMLLVLLILAFGWAIRIVIRRWRGGRAITRLALTVCGLNIVFAALLLLVIARTGFSGFNSLFYGIPVMAVPLLVLPVIAALLCIPLIRVLWKGSQRRVYRWHLLITVAAVLLWLYLLWDIGLYQIG